MAALSRLFAFLRRLLRWVLYGVLLLLGLLGVAYAGLVYVNLEDEALLPGITALMQERPPQLAPEQNGYFAWIGVMGPESVPPHAWGRQWWAEALAIDAKPRLGDEPVKPAIQAGLRAGSWPKDGPCWQVERCFDQVAGDRARVRALLAQARPTLERAEVAMAFSQVQEPWRPEYSLASPIAPYPRSLGAMARASFVLDLFEGRHQEALEQLARQQRFHVAQAVGAVSMIDKMVALAYLRDLYLMLGQYLHHHPREALAHGALIEAMLAPLPDPALDLRAAIRSETRALLQLLLSMREQGLDWQSAVLRELPEQWRGWLSDLFWLPFYQSQTTANTAYSLYAGYLEAEALSGEAYRRTLAAAERRRKDYRTSVLESLQARNPVGRVLASLADPGFNSFMFRRDDLRMIHAALTLRFRLLQGGTEQHQEQDLSLLQEQPGLVHPSTGQGPRWVEAEQALVYPAHELRRDKAALVIRM